MTPEQEVRLKLAESKLEQFDELRKSVTLIEQQLRDARIALLVLGVIGLVGGGFIGFAYRSVSEVASKRSEYITDIKNAANSAKSQLRVGLKEDAHKEVMAALNSQFRDLPNRVALVEQARSAGIQQAIAKAEFGASGSLKLCKTIALNYAWTSVTVVPKWTTPEGCRQIAIAQFGTGGGEAEHGCLFSDGSVEFSKSGNKQRLKQCGWD